MTVSAVVPRPIAEKMGTASAAGAFDDSFLRKLEALAIVARRTAGVDLRANRRSRRVGAGIEVADHRAYTPGDDVRALDWNLFGRLDRPFVRVREEEENLAVSVVVDTSASMGFGAPPKLYFAVRVAAALAYIGLRNLDRVSVALVGERVEAALVGLRGRAAALRVLGLLGKATAAGQTNLAAALRDAQVALGGRPRRGLTILISDLLDVAGCAPALDRLRAARQETLVVHVTTAEETALPPGGEVLLQDAETGETRALTLTPAVRRAHGARADLLRRSVAAACRQRGVRCFQIDAGVSFEDAVLRLLRGGGALA